MVGVSICNSMGKVLSTIANQYGELNVACGQAIMVLQITGETGARNITALHILKDILWMYQVTSH
jgi:hypothetical protein